jgi:catecholate siderophore receptor
MHQVGAVKVDGIEVGLSGNVTPKLSLSGGAVYMDTEITNYVNAANKGKKLANIAEKSASVQAKYQATPQLAVGGTLVHTGKFKGGLNFEAMDNRELPASNRLDLMAEYKINKKLNTQLNVKNATNKTIFEAVYPSGFTYIAPGRTTNVSLTYDF